MHTHMRIQKHMCTYIHTCANVDADKIRYNIVVPRTYTNTNGHMHAAYAIYIYIYIYIYIFLPTQSRFVLFEHVHLYVCIYLHACMPTHLHVSKNVQVFCCS
jgi:hypothetical protein